MSSERFIYVEFTFYIQDVALTLPKDFLKKYKHLRNLGRSHCHLQSWNFQWEIFNESLTNCGNLLYYYDLTFVKNLNVV